MNLSQWYVLQVMTGTEAECRRKAEKAGFKAVAPTRIMPEWSGRRGREREIVMLPGYVFVLCSGTIPEYYRLAAIPNAIRLLPGKGVYTPVPDSQMAWILELACGGKPWGISAAACAGGRLRVVSGPLTGHESQIQSWDRRRRRAKILIRVLDQRRLIDVGLTDIDINSP